MDNNLENENKTKNKENLFQYLFGVSLASTIKDGRMNLSIDMLFRYLFATKGKKVIDVANELGKTRSSLAGSLKHGRMNLGSLQELLAHCDEPLIIKLKNGDEIELILKDKKFTNGK